MIGAAVGTVIGTVRLFVKGARQQIQDDVKNAYHLKISDSVADQIEAIANKTSAAHSPSPSAVRRFWTCSTYMRRPLGSRFSSRTNPTRPT